MPLTANVFFYKTNTETKLPAQIKGTIAISGRISCINMKVNFLEIKEITGIIDLNVIKRQLVEKIVKIF